jgi:hypothetical protein
MTAMVARSKPDEPDNARADRILDSVGLRESATLGRSPRSRSFARLRRDGPTEVVAAYD